jgi:hypothetical protein
MRCPRQSRPDHRGAIELEHSPRLRSPASAIMSVALRRDGTTRTPTLFGTKTSLLVLASPNPRSRPDSVAEGTPDCTGSAGLHRADRRNHAQTPLSSWGLRRGFEQTAPRRGQINENRQPRRIQPGHDDRMRDTRPSDKPPLITATTELDDTRIIPAPTSSGKIPHGNPRRTPHSVKLVTTIFTHSIRPSLLPRAPKCDRQSHQQPPIALSNLVEPQLKLLGLHP